MDGKLVSCLLKWRLGGLKKLMDWCRAIDFLFVWARVTAENFLSGWTGVANTYQEEEAFGMLRNLETALGYGGSLLYIRILAYIKALLIFNILVHV